MLPARLHTHLLEAGIDEAGRGCYAGPVYAAAVILPPGFSHPALTDSKQLPEALRYELRPLIEAEALAWAVASVAPATIDRINILQATYQAMHQAISQLSITPQWLLIDGNRFKPYPGLPHTCLVKGDSKIASIAAASILAKTYRDDAMQQLHASYPMYDWLHNKGYGTRAHRMAIEIHGLCPHHRKSFAIGPGQLKLPL